MASGREKGKLEGLSLCFHEMKRKFEIKLAQPMIFRGSRTWGLLFPPAPLSYSSTSHLNFLFEKRLSGEYTDLSLCLRFPLTAVGDLCVSQQWFMAHSYSMP